MFRLMRIILTSVAILSMAAGLAQAQWPDDPTANLAIADLSGEQTQAKIRATPDGGAYVSWFDNSTGGYDVALQRLDADGNELWTHNGVLIADRGFSSTQDYDLDIDTSGNALLTFRDDRGGGTQITATKVSPAGAQLWGATGVQLTTGADFVAAPKIAGTTDGQVVVAWTNNSDVRLQKLDADGIVQWGAGVTIPAIGGDSTSASDMDASDAGGVIISMVRGFMAPKWLYAQKYSSAGTPQWGLLPLAVFDGGALQTANFPQFVPDGNGGAAFAWYSVDSGLQCHAQWVQADRTQAFGHNGVTVSTAPASRTQPAVSFNAATSETFVFWREETGGPSPEFGVYGQKLGPTGARLWGTGGVEVEPLSTTELVQVTQTATGNGAEVLWVETLAFAQQLVHASRLNNDGTFQWSPQSTSVSSVISSKSRLTVASTSDDAVLAVWSDGRNDVNDVYGQRIAPDGTLGNGSVPGSISDLMLDRSSITPGALLISWTQTCGTAQDYGIYEGTLGSWYAHTQIDCSDDGADLVEQIQPAAGDRYFLVVPLGASEEGSYGTDSQSAERPAGTAPCQAAQNLADCP
jgi:hypothetical protein